MTESRTTRSDLKRKIMCPHWCHHDLQKFIFLLYLDHPSSLQKNVKSHVIWVSERTEITLSCSFADLFLAKITDHTDTTKIIVYFRGT